MADPLVPRPNPLRQAVLWLQQTIEAWRERSALGSELAELRQRGELERTLADSGIAPSETERLLHAHPGSARQLSEMMERLGIDRSHLPLTNEISATLREIEWNCGECADWRQCRAWLSSGVPKEGHLAFCPNAPALEQLRALQRAAAPEAKTEAGAVPPGLRPATK